MCSQGKIRSTWEADRLLCLHVDPKHPSHDTGARPSRPSARRGKWPPSFGLGRYVGPAENLPIFHALSLSSASLSRTHNNIHILSHGIKTAAGVRRWRWQREPFRPTVCSAQRHKQLQLVCSTLTRLRAWSDMVCTAVSPIPQLATAAFKNPQKEQLDATIWCPLS